MSARDELDQWQALADGATEGPWRTTQEGLTHPSGWDIASPRGPVASECCGYTGSVSDRPDAEFIAAARTIVPAAVKALRDVLDELDEWERAGHLSIEMVHIRRAIEAAIGGEGR